MGELNKYQVFIQWHLKSTVQKLYMNIFGDSQNDPVIIIIILFGGGGENR